MGIPASEENILLKWYSEVSAALASSLTSAVAARSCSMMAMARFHSCTVASIPWERRYAALSAHAPTIHA
ncbi:hypothetical protein NtRootA4_36260 [Arthrobacter sp. NtRootA4]|nr:hypothetical protein NtRootA2_38470 [Arthrobacter sp. NtRootA2]BCW16647.1 hypothetical protein NtRootA4_36260 [Arthrobacter sp. NtRootA4]BCW24980.1 hypothetical protein NtRootC7_38470 [Arthrobacter sp. NtRootC7]BCW29249.1 hypothetical protein NtRootC45_38490 [Arthrobacter sp. NtRootC45]BCW33520.1 hypothetical protein NtRootD5_38510 [Arthrobacter sp. NtRootD5]